MRLPAPAEAPMQLAEAAWLRQHLADLPARDLYPMLDAGSSTAHFRSAHQPWIDALVFAPLRAQGHEVAHLDFVAGAGVDLVGDLMDEAFFVGLAARGFRSVLCANVLEHVADPAGVSRRLQALLGRGGYLIVTVPRRFPYHPDPIDNRLRPSVAEIAALFPGTTLIAGAEVDCGSFFDSLKGGWRELLLRICWLPLPFVRWRGWVRNVSRLWWMGRRFSATCAVLRLPSI